MKKTKTETSTKTTYIVKRNYTNDRTGTDVFVKLLTKKHHDNIGYIQQNIDNKKRYAILKIALESVVSFLRIQRRNRQ